jgi:hypothetical protein
MDNDVSKRVQILKRVLKHIYDDDYQDFGDRIVFGAESGMIKEGMSPADSVYMEKVRDELYRFFGQRYSQERTSLTPTADIEVLFQRLDAVPRPEGSKFATSYIQMWRESLGRASIQRSASVLSDPQVKVLEQRYAAEMLGKLEKVIARAYRLQKLDLERIPRRDVRTYFEEAHRCYLYGFNVACAVMCRAILESALKETIDPQGDLRPKERGESHILKMINKAKIYGRLSDPLPEWAAEVKDAGDSAVHGVEAFERDYPAGRLEDILCKARKVVESLYGPPVDQV